MERIKMFINKWGGVMLYAGMSVLLFCALVTCVACSLKGVYVFLGICGCIGLVPTLLAFIEETFNQYKEVKEK